MNNGGTPKLKEKLTARIQKVIDLDKQHSVLNNWERGFIDSVKEQVERRGRLSAKQLEIFAKAEAKCTPTELEKAQLWTKLYQEQHRETAKICARYYKATGYFAGLATSILEDSEFVPTERAYKKMCENKYAKKVLASARAKPLYIIGSTVVLRRPAISFSTRHLEDIPCLVLAVLDEVTSAAKGGKQYKVLPYGARSPFVFEERQLKKFKPGQKKTSKKKDTYSDVPF